MARGSRVVVLENDHSSPVLEWQTRAEAQGFTIDTVRQPHDGDWTSAVLATIGKSNAQLQEYPSLNKYQEHLLRKTNAFQ